MYTLISDVQHTRQPIQLETFLQMSDLSPIRLLTRFPSMNVT